MKPDNGAFVPENAATVAEFPSYGQTVLAIILEDQRRTMHARGNSGIHPGDRPELQIGQAMTALILASYGDERTRTVPVRINCREQLVFSSELMRQLLTTVFPGKSATAEGVGWYHYGLEIYLIGQNKEVGEKAEDDIELDVPAEIILKMRFLKGEKKVEFRVRAKKSGSDTKTEPLVKKRLVFRAFTLPDFAGKIRERLRYNPG